MENLANNERLTPLLLGIGERATPEGARKESYTKDQK
jgi:hypothetical protein